MAPTKTMSETRASSSILKLPLDTRNDPTLLHFNKLLYIPETGIWAPGKKSTPIFNFSSHFDRSLINWFTDGYIGINQDIMTQSKELAHAAISLDQKNSGLSSDELPNPSVIFKLARTHWYNDSKLRVTKPGYDTVQQVHLEQSRSQEPSLRLEQRQQSVTSFSQISSYNGSVNMVGQSSDNLLQNDPDGRVLADYSSPMLAYGVTNISFPANSEHSSHPITVRPINATRRCQAFVKDSVTYLWDVNRMLFPGGGGVLSLYKAVNTNKKIEIGRYQSDNGKFMPGGVLVIDTDEVDVLVAVLTLLGVLSQRDSFSVPTGTSTEGILHG